MKTQEFIIVMFRDEDPSGFKMIRISANSAPHALIEVATEYFGWDSSCLGDDVGHFNVAVMLTRSGITFEIEAI